jgi:hypothetical protein
MRVSRTGSSTGDRADDTERLAQRVHVDHQPNRTDVLAAIRSASPAKNLKSLRSCSLTAFVVRGIGAANGRRAEVTEDSVDIRQMLADRSGRFFTSSPMGSARG